VDGLLFLFLLILAVPICIIALFAGQSTLRARIAKLEEEVSLLRAGEPLVRTFERDPGLPSRRDIDATPWTPPAEPEPEPEPQPEPVPEPVHWVEEPWPERSEPRETFGSLFERFVAGRLLVWVGGAALVGAAILLIKHSIEIGLLTPQARMIGAAVFGFALVIAGEASPRIPKLADDPRVRQALVGAGIVTLFATPYGSHVLYGLIGSRTAAGAMFLVSAGALVMSLRHGAPTAVMGLVGAFLTPALVGDPSSTAVPLLVYLTLVNGAVFGIAWRRGWTWLAAGSVVFSFLWSFYLLGRPPGDAVATGFFVVALSLAATLIRPGRGRELAWVQPMLLGLIHLSLLVARTDLGPAAWALFGALAASAVALSLLREEHRFAPAAALFLALLLIAIKAPLRDPYVPWAAAAATLLFAGVSIPLAARGDRLLRTAVACAALTVPALLMRASWPELLVRPAWGVLALALAAAALFLAWLQRGDAGKAEPVDPPLFLSASAAALLLGAGVYDLLPEILLAAGYMAVALAVALSGRRLREHGFTLVAFAAAVVAGIRALSDTEALGGAMIESLLGYPATIGRLPPPETALLSLAIPGLLLAALAAAVDETHAKARRWLSGAAALFGLAALYIFAKQLFALGAGEDFDWRGFAERTAITQSLFLIGWLLASRRLALARFGTDRLASLGGAITLLAALRLVWFEMLIHNPLFDRQWVGTVPVANLLLPAYLLSAVWLYEARRRADAETRSGFWLASFLAALVWGVMLMVRQAFHGAWISEPGWPRAEVYMYSLAGLLLSAALIVGGMRFKDKAVRIAGLALLTATIVKVFWSDAAVLEGVLRILSFFGLGVGLIGVALLYGPVLRAEKGERTERPQE